MIKIYQVTESDWIAANSVADAIKCYVDEYDGEYDPECFEARELTDAELDGLKFIDDLADPENAKKQTFREHLQAMIAKGDTFPTYFATNEW